jgi:hypothetical protein
LASLDGYKNVKLEDGSHCSSHEIQSHDVTCRFWKRAYIFKLAIVLLSGRTGVCAGSSRRGLSIFACKDTGGYLLDSGNGKEFFFCNPARFHS